MKKCNIKVLLLIVICLLVTTCSNVFAGNATGKIAGSINTGIKYHEFGIQSPGVDYIYHQLRIVMNDEEYKAFCVDPGLHFKKGKKVYTCTPYEGNPGLESLVKAGSETTSTNDELQYALAIRFYGTINGLIMGKHLSHQKGAFMRHVLSCGAGDPSYIAPTTDQYGPCGSYFTGPNEALAEEVAFNAARSAGGANKDKMNGGTLEFRYVNTQDKKVTYEVTSTKEIKQEDIKFSCEGEGCASQEVDYQWSGKKGSVTVTAICDKDYNIKVEFLSQVGSVYACGTNVVNDQNVFIYVPAGKDTSMLYPGKPVYCQEGCCPEKIPEMRTDIHNCCADSTHSEAEEPRLNELFCDSVDPSVTKYTPKCGSSYYVDNESGLNSTYCKLYCTERVTVDIPGAITATSGRYFKLNGSPHVESYKRCRVRIDFPQWEEDYGAAVEAQVESYNSFQENKAYELMYEEAISKSESKNEKIEVRCWAEADVDTEPYNCDNKGNCSLCTAKANGCVGSTKVYNVSYTKYPIPNYSDRKSKYSYFKVAIDEDLRKIYDNYKIIKGNPYQNVPDESDPYVVYDLATQIQDIENYMSGMDGTTCDTDEVTCGNVTAKAKSVYKCKRNTLEDEKYENKNVPELYNTRRDAAIGASSAYDSATQTALTLELDIDKCVNYFDVSTHPTISGTPHPGKDAAANYQLSTSLNFYYSQHYLNEDGKLTLDKQAVDFKEENCSVSGPFTDVDGKDIQEQQPVYDNGKYNANGHMENVHDFRFASGSLSNLAKKDEYLKYLDDPYDVDKVFRHDAKYKAVCDWEEDNNDYKTLVQNGGTVEGSGEDNNTTSHSQEYKVYITTFTGTYQTDWQLSNLGSKGQFDQYFYENGTNTCTGESPSGASMLTCQLHVQYEIVLTGYCNNNPGGVANSLPEYCYYYEEDNNLFNFKVVDPSSVFPGGTTSENGKEYAYNWTNEQKGQEALKEIQSRGDKDSTYAPENLTYSYTLTPNDMKQIKKYNSKRILAGGYSDFNLTCDCGDACVSCESKFLENLADGIVRYDGKDHKVTGWNDTLQKKSFEQVRKQVIGGEE